MATKANIKIKEFSDTDVWTVQQTLDERWTKCKTEIQKAAYKYENLKQLIKEKSIRIFQNAFCSLFSLAD